MAEVLQCDYCGTVGSLHEKPWRRLEYVAEVSEVMTDTRDKHFCSIQCLKDWVEEELELA